MSAETKSIHDDIKSFCAEVRENGRDLDRLSGTVDELHAAAMALQTPLPIELLPDKLSPDMAHLSDCINDAFAGPPKRVRRSPQEAALELIRDIGEIQSADPHAGQAVLDTLADWFGDCSASKHGLALMVELKLVDESEIEDWAAEHG